MEGLPEKLKKPAMEFAVLSDSRRNTVAAYRESVWIRDTAGMWPQPEAPNFARLIKNANANNREGRRN